MTQRPVRSARLEARITPEALAVVKRAAEIQGRSISDFVVAAAQEVAHKTIEETELTRLSLEDQIAFAEAIITPPLISRDEHNSTGRPDPAKSSNHGVNLYRHNAAASTAERE
jgi:uncharacterized protein (DUF1778 family)